MKRPAPGGVKPGRARYTCNLIGVRRQYDGITLFRLPLHHNARFASRLFSTAASAAAGVGALLRMVSPLLLPLFRFHYEIRAHSERVQFATNNPSVQELHAAYKHGRRDGIKAARSDTEDSKTASVVGIWAGAMSGAIAVGAIWAAVAAFQH